jgi:hypothetical protein
MSKAVFSACIILFTAPAVGQIVYDQRTQALARRIVVANPDELNELLAIDQSKAYLLENQMNRFVQLVVLSDKSDARMLGMGESTKFRPLSFEFWQMTFRAVASKRRKAAELIRIGGDSVIRFTDGEEPRNLAIEGQNPLEISPPWARGPIRVILIRFSEQRSHRFYQESDTKDLTVFCEVGPWINEQAGVRLVRHLESAWGLGRVEVVLRSDDLFAAEAYFPWRYLFASGKRWLRLPELEAYDSSPTLICGRQRSGTMGCQVRTFQGSIGHVDAQ